MIFLRTVVLFAMVLLAFAEEESKPARNKRQQIAFHPRRGGRPPPYAVQMEPIVQYSQRDPLYNPSASSKSDDHAFYDDTALYNHYSNDPEPIIEIIIKESNETLPTPVPPPVVAQPRPTKEPIQVFYVKYEKKKGYGDTKPRVVYDPPVPALNPVEEHEIIKPDHTDERPEKLDEPAITEATSTEPSTTLRTVIRPDSEVYHSGSSGIRVTFGTDQVPPNNHNKRSEATAPSSNPPAEGISATALPPPGSPKRQHGPYHPLQPAHSRVTPAFPQQRIVNSFPPQQQQLPPNYPGSHQQFHQPPLNGPRPQQRPPITIQGLPELHQRLPFQNFGTPHRISISHPQQPGFPHTLSVSHQSVHIQNQPPSLLPAGNFNADVQQQRPYQQQHQPQQPPNHQQQPRQPPQPLHHQQQSYQPAKLSQQPPQSQNPSTQPQIQSYKQQELEKQRYHQEQRRQQELRNREQQRQQEQQRQLEQQRQQDHQRKLEQQRIIEQQRQQDQRRQQERQRQEEQQRIQDQQRYHLEQQQRRKQEQENKLLQAQQYREQLNKFTQPSTIIEQPYNQQLQHSSQQTKPGGEILKAVPKLEQHYAIRENPLHPGPFPPNPQIQNPPYSEIGQKTFAQQSLSSPDNGQQQQYFVRNQPTNIPSIATAQQHQQTQLQIHKSIAQNPNYQNNQESFFAQNLPTPHQQRIQASSPSLWGRPVFYDNGKDKIYATPVSISDELESTTARTVFQTSISSTALTTTTTTPAPTTPSATVPTPKDEARIKENIANLPDEVPDDIRQQLLSSGILGNADIQILDYDKVGGIPIENLPPEALANFYGAGGAAATAASEPIPSIAKRPKYVPGNGFQLTKKKSTFTKVEQATLKPGGVEMKVVHFDPNTAQGQAIADQHIREDATHLKPVAIGSRTNEKQQYNRYLPLKVSGASFPIPDAPELQGRKISSVVVLAPVDYSGFHDDPNDQTGENGDNVSNEENEGNTRRSRMLGGPQPVTFLAGETLKQLVKKPSAENYKKWLEQESHTEPQRQSVVLLVTTLEDDSHGDKEIFMYDVSSQLVSKLSGDLSSAFVNAAESNSDSSDNIDDSTFATY